MVWIILAALVGLALYFAFSRKLFPTDAHDYAEQARTKPVSSSFAGSRAEQFYSNNATKTIAARQQLAAALNELYKTEGQARIAQSDNDLQVIRHYLAHELQLLHHDNEKQIINKASEKGRHAATYIKMEEKRQTEKIELKRKEKESNIEVKRITVLAEHDIEMDFRKKMNTLVAITRYKHLQYDEFDEIRGRLISLLEEAHRIENSDMNVYLKSEIMSQIQKAIQAYQEVFNVHRRRLVESGDREAVRQIDSITGLTGSGESGNPSTPFKLHTPQSGERD